MENFIFCAVKLAAIIPLVLAILKRNTRIRLKIIKNNFFEGFNC